MKWGGSCLVVGVCVWGGVGFEGWVGGGVVCGGGGGWGDTYFCTYTPLDLFAPYVNNNVNLHL